MSLDKNKASGLEAEKLISEIQNLIQVKGLNVDLIPKDGQKLADMAGASGCTGCTLCSCVICW